MEPGARGLGYLLFAVGELGRDGLVGGEGTKQGIEAVEAVFREAALLDLVSCGFAELRLTDGHGEVGSEQGGERGADESRRRDRSLWAGISTLAILGQLWQTAHEGLGARSREQQQLIPPRPPVLAPSTGITWCICP